MEGEEWRACCFGLRRRDAPGESGREEERGWGENPGGSRLHGKLRMKRHENLRHITTLALSISAQTAGSKKGAWL